ncbi:MAG: META domain-containing protein, partial [Rikenellaceae bacterium]
MKRVLTLSIFAAMFAILTSCCGCKGAKSKNPYFLTTQSWQLVEMNQEKIEATEDSYTITFNEKEHRVFGCGDCNRYFSTYTEKDVRKLEFQAM